MADNNGTDTAMTLSQLLTSSLLERSVNAAQQGAGLDLGEVSTFRSYINPELSEAAVRARVTGPQLIYCSKASEQVQTDFLVVNKNILKIPCRRARSRHRTCFHTFRNKGQSKDAGSGIS